MDDDALRKIKEKKLRGMMDAHRAQQRGVLEADTDSFDGIIGGNDAVLVDFWAEWCGPCKMMHPVFERMAKKYGRIRFARLNVDLSQPIAQRFQVQSIPTFILFKGGRMADKMIGAVGEPGIHMIIKKHDLE